MDSGKLSFPIISSINFLRSTLDLGTSIVYTSSEPDSAFSAPIGSPVFGLYVRFGLVFDIYQFQNLHDVLLPYAFCLHTSLGTLKTPFW